MPRGIPGSGAAADKNGGSTTKARKGRKPRSAPVARKASAPKYVLFREEGDGTLTRVVEVEAEKVKISAV